MTFPGNKEKETSKNNDPIKVILQELDEVNRSIKETSEMVEQSRVEVGKLSQRNTAVTSSLQKIQDPGRDAPVEDVRQAYDTAMDAQQRLYVMRGQLDKLQIDLIHLEEKKKFLEKMHDLLHVDIASGKGDGGILNSVEMLVNAQESERQKLSRQMHDGPAQALSNFILQTEIALRLMDIDESQARKELNDLKSSAMKTFQNLRNFIFELRPMMLDDLGVVPTIHRYADTFKEQTGIDVLVTVTGNERRMPSYIEVLLFRAMQELLGHAVHQNQATIVKVILNLDEKSVKLSVDDNGKGYDTETLGKDEYLGQKLLKERVEVLGGNWSVDSSPGMGSRVTCIIPLLASNPTP
jgi:two-component system sensor histidine kinase DegS